MSGTADGADGAVSKVQVKREIKTIVDNLETILGDLKDVAKELKEVVHDIDTLTCDLQLEEDGLTDSSKTDTLNSSSSSTATITTAASSLEKMKLLADDCLFVPPAPVAPILALPPAVLTVHKKAHPPLPPPRLTSARAEDYAGKTTPQPTFVLSGNLSKANGSLLKNGGVFSLKPNRDLFSPTSCFITNDGGGVPESGLVPTLPRPMPLLRHEKNKCPKAPGREPRERERVRFSEKVQYHGYCPDCDLQYDVDDSELRLQAELNDMRLSPVHCCAPSSPPPHPRQLMLENGGLSVSHSFPPKASAPPPPPCAPPRSGALKPQKTILRKSTTTTV
ncbi:protein Largen [Syngnathoides biaculeatus]|uniref:protein Largen n=1 Tax=Syngnathoides biaculeatus TaxID=300417 RepID=UPI002ADD5FA3|nr:protein Largen [Syngnathoides biaculeatus]XP_061674326.1 protein Largen [Syngnathoides biaculeatus]